MTFSNQGHDYSIPSNLKMVQHTAILTMADQRKVVYDLSNGAILNDLTPSFKVTPFFNAEYIINGTTYKHCFNEILIGTYTRPSTVLS